MRPRLQRRRRADLSVGRVPALVDVEAAAEPELSRLPDVRGARASRWQPVRVGDARAECARQESNRGTRWQHAAFARMGKR